jgi:hypothetical protein
MPRHFQDFVKQSEGGLICLINQTARTVNGVTPTFIFLFLGCIYYIILIILYNIIRAISSLHFKNNLEKKIILFIYFKLIIF